MTMMHWSRLSVVLGLGLAVLTAAAAPPSTRPSQTTTQPAAAEPWVKSVSHAPQQPKTGDPVKVTASIAPDFTDVVLQYQLVEPGNYIELKDPEYAQNWTPIPMQKPGEANRGPRLAFTADLPANLQKHRRL